MVWIWALGYIISTKKAIEVAVRSRLRGARIYTEHSVNYLYVRVLVQVDSGALSIAVRLVKQLYDPVSERYAYGVSRETGSLGTSRTPNFILNNIGQLTDEFIDEYLHVNAEAC